MNVKAAVQALAAESLRQATSELLEDRGSVKLWRSKGPYHVVFAVSTAEGTEYFHSEVLASERVMQILRIEVQEHLESERYIMEV